MIKEVKDKFSSIRDLGTIDISPEHIVCDFEKELLKYKPLKAYDVDGETKN